MGLTFLAKETSIVLLFAIYAFLALTPELRVRLRDLAISMGVMVLVIAPFPLSIVLAGAPARARATSRGSCSGGPNHDWVFYASNVPEMIGPLVLAAAVAGLVLLRRRGSWPETAAPVLDRRARPVLRAVAGEGVPVPPADRGAGGRARRALRWWRRRMRAGAGAWSA